MILLGFIHLGQKVFYILKQFYKSQFDRIYLWITAFKCDILLCVFGTVIISFLPDSSFVPFWSILNSGTTTTFTKTQIWQGSSQLIKNPSRPGPMSIFLSFFFLKNFYWSIVDLQCCVSFRYTAKWISYTYTYIHSVLDSFPI